MKKGLTTRGPRINISIIIQLGHILGTPNRFLSPLALHETVTFNIVE